MADKISNEQISQAAQLLPVLTSAVLPADPIQRASVLRAKIKNFENMRSKFPLMGTFYTNEIRKMKAKLSAAEEEIKIKREGQKATRQWRSLGQAGVVTGILVGVSLIVLITSAATSPKVRGTKGRVEE